MPTVTPRCERIRSVAILATVAALVSAPGGAAPAAPVVRDARARGGAKAKGKDSGWLELSAALTDVRAKARPALVLYDPGGPDGAAAPLAAAFDGYLENRIFAKGCRGFALVRLGPDDLDKVYPRAVASPAKANAKRKRSTPRRRAGGAEPPAPAPADPVAVPTSGPSAREVLVLHRDRAALLVLSFREQVVERFTGELPDRTALRKSLARVVKVNAIHAREDKRVGAILEKSLYAFENGKRKAAVLAVRDFEQPKRQRLMDDTLKKRTLALIERYRKEAKKEMDRADALDQGRQYKDALEAYNVVLKDFPFPAVSKRCAVRIGEIARKLQFATGKR